MLETPAKISVITNPRISFLRRNKQVHGLNSSHTLFLSTFLRVKS